MDNGNPLVTVVVPTVRGGRFLHEAVESVLRQTESRWALTIVSDGCPDPLGDYEQSDGRIRVLRQARSGVSIARNRAIAASATPYIAFLDDDDRMMPNRLESELAQLARTEAALVHTQVDVIDERGRFLEHRLLHEVQYLDLLRGDAGIVTSSVMLRRSALDTVGVFDPLLRAAEDLELYLRVARQYPLAFIDEPLVEYRMHGSNQYTPPRVYQRDFVTIYRKHLNDALRDHDAAVAGAAREGIRRFAEWNATRAIDAARRRGLPRGLADVMDAVRLSPGHVARGALRAVRRRIPARAAAATPHTVSTTRLHTRVLPTAALSGRDIDDWLDLVTSASEPNPYFSPEYLTSPVDDTGVPVVDSVLVAVDDDGAWVGVAALWNGHRDDAWPLRHLSTGWFHVSTPLLRRGREDEALQALVAAVLRRPGGPPVLDFPFLPATSATVLGLRQAAQRLGLGIRTRASAVGPWLAPRPDAGGWTPKTSQRERRIMRHLAAHLGVADLRLRDISDDPDAVDRYLALEEEGWKAASHGGYGLTRRPQWFRTVYERLRAREAIRMLVLDGPQGTAYLGLLLVEQGVAYGFLDTYPDSLRDLSPGTIGRLLTLRHCAEDERISAFEPSVDLAQYPAAGRIFPDRRDWLGVTLARRGWPSLVLPHLASRQALFVRRVIHAGKAWASARIHRG